MNKLFALMVAATACGNTTSNSADQLNLNRPVDIAFACYGGLRLTSGGAATPQQDIATTAQPIEACNVRSGDHDATAPVPVPPGQEDLTAQGGQAVPAASFFGFILQSAPGTVAVARFDTKPSSAFTGGSDVVVLDADPLTPGKNGISVGEEPIAIATDSVGCFEVTANAGSCDMSTLEINTALGNNAAIDVNVRRLEVKNAAGQALHARPAAMAMQSPGGVIGNACPATSTGIAYVAFPNCHLVAGVDTATMTVVEGIQYDAAGVPTRLAGPALGNLSCPAECGGGGTLVAGVRPVTLDLQHDERTGRRLLAIGSDNSPAVTLVELDVNYRPTNVQQLALQSSTGGPLGVTSVAISPTIGMGGSSGIINDDSALGGQAQFIYAVSTDNTVRVADVLQLGKECDTQLDPRFIHDIKDVKKLSCWPVDDVNKPPRRTGVRGPGIELVGDAVPTSVAFVRIDPVPSDSRLAGTPSRMIGYFAIITGSNGGTYVANVDNDDYADYVDVNDPLTTQIPLDIAHQLRDALPTRGAIAETLVGTDEQLICNTNGPDPDATTGNSDGPRQSAPPARNFPAGVIASNKSNELPYLRQVLCTGTDTTMPVTELAFAAPTATRDLAFPDLKGLRADETWTLTWEGSLSNDLITPPAVDGPNAREGQLAVDSAGLHLVDGTHPFCDAGVEPFDVVQLRGCDPANGDLDCAIGFHCYVHPQSQVSGLGACMLADEADRLATACKSFLTSLRRYTVGTTTSGELQLLPRKYVLRTTPLSGCVDDAQCAALATYAVKNNSSVDPATDMTIDDMHTWKCMVDGDRKPLVATGNTNKRCVQTCAVDADCALGRVCDGGTPGTPGSGTCMEGVVPPQACVNAAQRYELRAGEAFSVVGSRSGYVHPIVADASGACIRDPKQSPLTIGRIPLVAPACDPTADPRTGKRTDGTFEPNPCSLTVDNSELQPSFVAGTCTPASPASKLVSRPATAIKFRNRGMTFSITDPTYPGDAMCIGDRGGSLSDIPLVFPGFQLAFRQTAGFTPLSIPLPLGPSYPVKVVRGPQQSIWVIDEGDYLSTSITTASTRGKVYRIESPSYSTINLLQ